MKMSAYRRSLLQRINDLATLLRASQKGHPKRVRQPAMGLDHQADRSTRRSRRIAQKRLSNEYRQLIERRQTMARRLKQIEAVLRGLDNPGGLQRAAF